MGVINVTPDSFSDGGYFDTTEKAIEQARRLIQEGADILDIGGESTRPGSRSVGGDEELLRVMPVIEFALSMDIPVSVDTSKPEVMRATIDAGVDLVNDINALRAPGSSIFRCGCRSHIISGAASCSSSINRNRARAYHHRPWFWFRQDIRA